MTPSSFYAVAKSRVIELGYAEEIEWQGTRHPGIVDERQFLREAAWVIYCSGFKEQVVRRHFNYLSLCFFEWSSSVAIVEKGTECVATAMHGIANRGKHEAVVVLAKRIAEQTFGSFWPGVVLDPIATLQRFPFLGPITAVHLAKNLGFDVAKPDRHLVRLSDRLGCGSVGEMCDEIANTSGDPVRVVDLVLWRFMEQRQQC